MGGLEGQRLPLAEAEPLAQELLTLLAPVTTRAAPEHRGVGVPG